MQRAYLLVANDVTPDAETDFNRWYENQHLAERLGVPGFLNARRYLAQSASLRYVAFYETEGVETFTSAAYRARLAGPTDWTQRVMPSFRNMHRTVMRAEYRLLRGMGALLDMVLLDGTGVVSTDTYEEIAARCAEDAAFEGMLVLREVQLESASGTPEGSLRPGKDAAMARVALLHWAHVPGHVPADARSILQAAGLRPLPDVGGRYALMTARGRIDFA
jgi:hypothetical protein